MIRPTALLLAAAVPALAACDGGAKTPAAAPPAHGEAVAYETELLKLTLTPQAVVRLGIRTERAGAGRVSARREASGEVVAPNVPGGVPISSVSNLQQIGAQQALADGELERTRAQLRLAEITARRAGALVREDAGSVRARDEAEAALAAARAQAKAASAHRRLLGPAVATLGNQTQLGVRVPVFGSDIASVAQSAAAEIRPLGGKAGGRIARPVAAPPSSNAVAGTVDLYYALDNRDRSFRIGQRVSVALPLSGSGRAGLTVPASAIVSDIYGGDWVYLRIGRSTYLRQRIEIGGSAGGRMIVTRGIAAGAEVVIVGAMELFGTEFGVAH